MRRTALVLALLGAVALPAFGQTAATRGPAPTASPSAAAAHAGAAPSQPALASGQFSSEQAAKAHCPADTIVWVNLGGSKAYHTSNDRYFGKTKHGTYMCQKEAEQAGFHAPGARAGKTATKTTNGKPATTK